LSHSIGEATIGWIDEAFDHACIKHFADSDDESPRSSLRRCRERATALTRSATGWSRTPLLAAGFELIDYFPSPQTLVGAGFAAWKLSPTWEPNAHRSGSQLPLMLSPR
jgi:hypothetical protein